MKKKYPPIDETMISRGVFFMNVVELKTMKVFFRRCFFFIKSCNKMDDVSFRFENFREHFEVVQLFTKLTRTSFWQVRKVL